MIADAIRRTSQKEELTNQALTEALYVLAGRTPDRRG
jgi:hypothetical protein